MDLYPDLFPENTWAKLYPSENWNWTKESLSANSMGVKSGVQIRMSAVDNHFQHPVPLVPNTLFARLISEDENSWWAMNGHLVSDDGANIAAAICNRTAIAITDGSFNNSHGILAYIIEGDEPKRICLESMLSWGTWKIKAHHAMNYWDVLGLLQQ